MRRIGGVDATGIEPSIHTSQTPPLPLRNAIGDNKGKRLRSLTSTTWCEGAERIRKSLKIKPLHHSSQ